MSDTIANFLNPLLKALHEILPDWAFASVLLSLILALVLALVRSVTDRGFSPNAHRNTHATTINVNVAKDSTVSVTKKALAGERSASLPEVFARAERRRRKLREIASLDGEEGEDLLVA